MQTTIKQETHDKLMRIQALMRHQIPSGDLAEILDRALDALIEKVEKTSFGATSRPRATKARSGDADPHHVPNAVKRAVRERDDEQCAFVSADGLRCTERGYLEFDHTTPAALGGQPTVGGVRLLCKGHNQYEAERILGADFMRAKREAAIAARKLESDVTDALVRMGFKSSESRSAVTSCALPEDSTFDQRIRAALATLTRSRCQEAMPVAWSSAERLRRALA